MSKDVGGVSHPLSMETGCGPELFFLKQYQRKRRSIIDCLCALISVMLDNLSIFYRGLATDSVYEGQP